MDHPPISPEVVEGREPRKALLFRALPFALLPAVLFVPALAILTVCPPAFGPFLMCLLAAAFVASEAHAVPRLVWVLRGRIDWVTGIALVAAIIGSLVFLASLWGLVLAILRFLYLLPPS